MSSINQRFSRPARAGAFLLGADDSAVQNLFVNKAILVRLEQAYSDSPDAQETFYFALNQCLRFCPNVYVDIPQERPVLKTAYQALGAALYEDFRGAVVSLDSGVEFSAVVNVGTEMRHDLPWVAINSNGWVARVATAGSPVSFLPVAHTRPNALGALAAACFGAEAAFFFLLGLPKIAAFEFSLHTLEQAELGQLHPGPNLPKLPLRLEGAVVGCGSVTNGWAYAMKRLPVIGSLDVIDNEKFLAENLGSYVSALKGNVGEPKVDIVRRALSPQFSIEPCAEAWELFKIRLKYGHAVPPVIISGLDNVTTRHSVQKLWPEILVDMGAGGLTSQVLVKRRDSAGLCVLRALTVPEGEISWVERMAQLTGLNPSRILEANTPISEDDLARSSSAFYDELVAGRAEGQLLCGRLTKHDLEMEGENPQFTPAVPFVTAHTGIVAAAETLRWLMGNRRSFSLHYQRSFQSDRSAAREMLCAGDCECQKRNGRGATEQRRRPDIDGGKALADDRPAK